MDGVVVVVVGGGVCVCGGVSFVGLIPKSRGFGNGGVGRGNVSGNKSERTMRGFRLPLEDEFDN